MLTLHEFLARILLEEGLMNDRTGQIINHELEDRFNLLFGIASIISKRIILEVGLVSSKFLQDGDIEDPRLTHSPRSRISRAIYIAAAPTWLGR